MVVGRVGRPHGLKGLVFVHPDTDHPDRFHPGAIFEAGDQRLAVETCLPYETGLLVRFVSIADRDAAEELRGRELAIPAEQRRDLAPDEFWPDELVGMVAYDPTGTLIGPVVEVIEGAAQHRLAIETRTGIIEVPFVADLVPEVDEIAGRIVIVPIPGLLS